MKIYLDHIGIACDDLDESSSFWKLIGLIQGDSDEVVEDQGVKTRFFSTSINDPKIYQLECHYLWVQVIRSLDFLGH